MRRIGNFVLFFCLFSFFYIFAEPEVKIKFYSSDEEKIRAAVVGVPFILKISVHDIDDVKLSEIKGLDNFKILENYPTQKKISCINGRVFKEHIFSYLLLAERQGKFTLGPVIFSLPRNLNSPTLSIEVKEIEHNEHKFSEIYCNVHVDRKKVFVGQKIPFSVVFSTSNPKIELNKIERPNWENVRIENLSEPKFYKDVRNSKKVNILEIKGYLVPLKPGNIVLRALKATYLMASKKKDFWDSFFPFFADKELKQLYSNVVNLEVAEIPYYSNPVNGIGNFKKITFDLDPKKIEQFQGITGTLTLEGEGDLEGIKHPILNLPKNFKYYESKSFIKQSENQQKKYFEYIIQGLEPGKWKIGLQKFTFFDPQRQKFITLNSKSVSVEILETALQVKKENRVTDDQKKQTEILELKKDDSLQEILKEIGEIKEKYRQIMFIPWKYFIGIILLFLLIKLIILLKVFLTSSKPLSSLVIRRMQWRLKRLYNKNDFQLWYNIIKESLGEFFIGKKVELPDDEIIQYLKDYGFNEDFINEYISLILVISRYSQYSQNQNQSIDKISAEKIFYKLNNWLNRLKKCKKISKKAIIFNLFFFILFLGSNLYALEKENNDEKILQEIRILRKMEKNASIFTKNEINNAIHKLKKSHLKQKGIEENCDEKLHQNLFFSKILYYINIIPLIFWQILFLFLLFVIFYLSKFFKKYINLCFLLLLLFDGIILGFIYCENKNIKAIVIRSTVPVFIGPGHDYPRKARLNFLDEVDILKSQNIWFYISSSCVNGWVNSKDIELI